MNTFNYSSMPADIKRLLYMSSIPIIDNKSDDEKTQIMLLEELLYYKTEPCLL